MTAPEPECAPCMGRYANLNLIHAQRRAYVEKRLAELAVEDPTHYFADEWNALYDAAIDLHVNVQPVA